MPTRTPVVAGQFYPASADECRNEIQTCLSHAEETVRPQTIGALRGGVVPHAGWVCSGAVAAQVIELLARGADNATWVLFGAVHRVIGKHGSVFAAGSWRTPLGESAIDEELAGRTLQASSVLEAQPEAHQLEHSIEVQLPIIQHLDPGARLLPIMVPPSDEATQIGRLVARQARELERPVLFLGSSDLTHYGPRYGFTPKGAGPEGLRWAKEVNDRRLIDLVLEFRAEQIVPETARHQNACGAGAIAATIAACQEMGARTAHLLRHTTSDEVLRDRLGAMSDAVGYAGLVFADAAEN